MEPGADDTIQSIHAEEIAFLMQGDGASVLEETIAHVQFLQYQKIQLEKVKQEKLLKLKHQKNETAEVQASEQSGEVNFQWLKKTSSHGTEVDMRILQDEIHVSIVQQHLPRFLLRMVTVLETKLKLDIMNATGSVIDGFDVYSFKVKIKGNSCAKASEIMNKILDNVDSVF
ncbi:hypothetical protein MPTK1_2g06470 [Marchantia polymorpha subsp. ruderalis]|uniref:Uncharacterized protein n=2 Tax=Marchantia polymorpha TaxID=3197 RepID=A0A176WCD8_MARPO|nr:hypothetical protein AXG93_3522s1170 [Marchantia polymorpha subsp. ruderalis]PTQ44246.1 hypothetical protein MARPO_0021s0102 [Marchantia polymorpha]BBN01321.1 hypothetical protein Mp_2g06470 [Marchantia polymorpha subsp. ruderalis]|eukprot:PTQ44246.1 hypothetical protein MARPO_0021s0102 [Marchantia polymorpha]